MNDDANTTQYEIRIGGVLSERLLSAFPEMRARTRHHETVLSGSLADQSALHGVLGRIEAFGLELIEVRRLRARTNSPAPGEGEPVDVVLARPPEQPRTDAAPGGRRG